MARIQSITENFLNHFEHLAATEPEAALQLGQLVVARIRRVLAATKPGKESRTATGVQRRVRVNGHAATAATEAPASPSHGA